MVGSLVSGIILDKTHKFKRVFISIHTKLAFEIINESTVNV